MLTIGTPHKTDYYNPEGIATVVEEGDYQHTYANSGLIQRAVNKYQVTEQWASFEIIDERYYDRAILFSVLFDSLIILSWRFTRIARARL